MNGNLGASRLRRRRHSGDPMAVYDALPAPLRRWLSEAALPWSPVSAGADLVKSQAKGLSLEDALIALDKAEAKTLAGDRSLLEPKNKPQT